MRYPLSGRGRIPCRAALFCMLLAPLLPVRPAQAQDVEAAARAHGRVLPQGYFERVRQEPSFFEIAHGWTRAAERALQARAPVGGRLPLLVVPALFADSPEPAVAAAELQRAIFDGPAPEGTLSAYYREVSGGRLALSGQVGPWVRTALTRAEVVGGSYGLGGDARVGEYLVQALAGLDGTLDFGPFDNDGPDGIPNSGDDDGFVDALVFLYLERAASCGGEGIWPHRSRIAGWMGEPFRTSSRRPDGSSIFVDDYIIQSAVTCEAGEVMTMGTIAHELGHVLGLPDLYDSTEGILPAQRRWVLGCWTLMAAGAWGCGDGATFARGRRPPHMGPWEKEQLGWIAEVTLGEVRDREVRLEPVQTSGQVLRVALAPGEYLQLEYRPNTGFDAELPAGGVLVYQVEPGRPLRPCPTCARLYRIALVEADGNGALVRTAAEGGNRGEAGDAFGVGGPVSFSGITTPAVRLNSGALTPVTFHAIVVEEGVARVRLSTAATPAVVAGAPLPTAPALSGYRAEVRVAGGTLPYQWSLQGELPRGITATPGLEALTLEGAALRAGSFPLALELRDAMGRLLTQALTLVVGALESIPLPRLLQAFVNSSASPLSVEERTYLDEMGNRNGRYDVGDLRAHLLADPAATAQR